jgi:uncharacterized membrane protein YjjP (DUF1212 family)
MNFSSILVILFLVAGAIYVVSNLTWKTVLVVIVLGIVILGLSQTVEKKT